MTKFRTRFGFVLLLTAAVPAMAAEWHFDPQMGLTVQADDNYYLTDSSFPKQSVTTGVVDVGGNLTGRTGTTRFLLAPRARLAVTTPNIDRNSNDGFLDMNIVHTGLKSEASLIVRFSHQDLFRLYLPGTGVNFDLGGISTTTDLRSISGRNSQNLLNVNPSVSWRLTQRTRLTVGGYYTDSAYSSLTRDYVDYRNSAGLVGVDMAVTRRDNIGLTLTGSQFQATGSKPTNTYGLRAQWDRRLSEISRYYFRLGNETTRTSGTLSQGAQKSISTTSAGAGINWVFQITGLFIDATRDVNPYSVGAVARQTELRVRWQRLLSPKLSTWVGVHGTQFDVLGISDPAADGSRYFSANFGLDWRFSRAWSLVPSVYLVSQRLNRLSNDGRSNSVHLLLLYDAGRKTQDAAVRVQPYQPY